tara:strand:- start:353 stop:568 length:216 start_codon:yes stop_codon:yes gene_type:complete
MTIQEVRNLKTLNKAHKTLLKYLQAFHMPLTPKTMTSEDKVLEKIYMRIELGRKQYFKPTLNEAIESALSL